jgi:hypothetical protein
MMMNKNLIQDLNKLIFYYTHTLFGKGLKQSLRTLIYAEHFLLKKNKKVRETKINTWHKFYKY